MTGGTADHSLGQTPRRSISSRRTPDQPRFALQRRSGLRGPPGDSYAGIPRSNCTARVRACGRQRNLSPSLLRATGSHACRSGTPRSHPAGPAQGSSATMTNGTAMVDQTDRTLKRQGNLKVVALGMKFGIEARPRDKESFRLHRFHYNFVRFRVAPSGTARCAKYALRHHEMITRKLFAVLQGTVRRRVFGRIERSGGKRFERRNARNEVWRPCIAATKIFGLRVHYSFVRVGAARTDLHAVRSMRRSITKCSRGIYYECFFAIDVAAYQSFHGFRQ